MENVFSEAYKPINMVLDDDKPLFKKPLRSAFVFISTESDSFDVALEDLRHIEGVNEIYQANGAYDLIAKVSAESFNHLRELVFYRIKNLSSIKSTLTLTLIDATQK